LDCSGLWEAASGKRQEGMKGKVASGKAAALGQSFGSACVGLFCWFGLEWVGFI